MREEFEGRFWNAMAAQDFVTSVLRKRHAMEVVTPVRPYTRDFPTRRMTVLVDPQELSRMRGVMLERIRARHEWDDLSDDDAVIEELLAKLEEGILSAYPGVELIEFHNGYFRPHRSSPPRDQRAGCAGRSTGGLL